MTRLGLYFLLLLLSGAVAAQETKQDTTRDKKNTAAVLDFNVISGIQKTEALALTSRFRNAFASTKKYVVLERNEMDEILKAQDFSMSDNCNSSDCAVELGKLLASEKIISGDIGKVGETYTISVRMIDVTTGRIELTVTEEYKGKADGLLGVFDVMAQKITGTYVAKSSKTWWWIGGAVVAGGVVTLLTSKKAGGGANETIGNPPATPPTIP